MEAENLKTIADQIAATNKPRRMTVRQLLAAVGQKRRGKNVLNLLKVQMRKSRLKTNPDFWSVPLDTRVTVLLAPRLGRRPNRPWNTAHDATITTNTEAAALLQVSVSENVTAAFNCLHQAMQTEVDRLNEAGAAAFKRADYSAAKSSAHKAEQVAALLARTTELSRDWKKLTNRVPPRPASPPDKGHRRNFGRLERGARTPETEFYVPILVTLLEMGGRGEVSAILESVRAKMASVLKPADFEKLPANNKTKSIRWWNSAQWARFTLKKRGYLKADSLHGIWEITEKGRAFLAELKAQASSDTPDGFQPNE